MEPEGSFKNFPSGLAQGNSPFLLFKKTKKKKKKKRRLPRVVSGASCCRRKATLYNNSNKRERERGGARRKMQHLPSQHPHADAGRSAPSFERERKRRRG